MMLMGIEMPLMAIRNQICSGIDIIIHLGRLRDNSRRVLEIAEVDSMRDDQICLQPLFLFEETGVQTSGQIEGDLVKKEKLIHTGKLKLNKIAARWPAKAVASDFFI